MTAARVGDLVQVAAERTAAEHLAMAGISLGENSSVVGAVLADILVPAPGGARIVSSHWTSSDTLGHGAIGARALITCVRCEAEAMVGRTVELTDSVGDVLVRGDQLWAWSGGADSAPQTDFCTREWGELLRNSLDADPAFTMPLSTWDGAIGLRCNDIGSGTREVHLRIYRGSVIDVVARTPNGATFTFVASAQQWCEIALGPKNDFMRRAIAGDFSSAGDGYEYVRLTRALSVIMSHVRAVAGQRERSAAS